MLKHWNTRRQVETLEVLPQVADGGGTDNEDEAASNDDNQ